MTRCFVLLGAAGSASIALACGSSDASNAGPQVPDPTVKITQPADGDTVTITNDPDVQVGFAVTHFDLKDVGTCAGASACGHVQVSVDGHNCDDHENGMIHPYNAESTTSPVGAGLDYCTDAVMGVPAQKTYSIVVGLYDDKEAPVMNSAGKAVTDSIKINVKVAPSTDAGSPDAGH